MNNDILKLLVTSLSTVIPMILLFLRQQTKYEENIKRIDNYLIRNSDQFEKLEKSVISINDTINLLRQELIEKVAENRLDNEKLNTEVEKLKTRVDNIEKIIDRRKLDE